MSVCEQCYRVVQYGYAVGDCGIDEELRYLCPKEWENDRNERLQEGEGGERDGRKKERVRGVV